MSGIINTAGSKSGIIGTTELDYESGTADIGLQHSSNTPPAQTKASLYTKIGNIVFITVQISIDEEFGTSGGIAFTNLPFTSSSVNSLYYTGDVGVMVNMETAVSNVALQIPYNETDCAILKDHYGTGTHASVNSQSDIDTGTLFRCNFSYRTN